MNITVHKCTACGSYDDELVGGLCVDCEIDMNETETHLEAALTLMESYDDIWSIMEDVEDEYSFLENPCQCGRFEIYSEILTNGLCLNCYHDFTEDLTMAELEWVHDTYQNRIHMEDTI